MCAKNHITYLKVSGNNDPSSTTWLLSGVVRKSMAVIK